MKSVTKVTNATLNMKNGYCGLSATVVHDPSGRFPEGDNILTSMVQQIDLVGRTIETKNTIYDIWGDIHINDQGSI